MRNDPVDDADRVGQHAPVPRRDRARPIALQQLERMQVGSHIAIGRQDHRCHPIEHVISGEQQTLFFEQKTNMIRRMTRRVNGAQTSEIGRLYSMRRHFGVASAPLTSIDFEHTVVARLECRDAGHVLQSVRRRRQAHDLRSRGICQRPRATRVVAMRMRHENETQTRRRAPQSREVLRIVRPRIEHGYGRTAEHVGVGARARHERRIGCNEPLHARRETHEPARLQIVG